MIRSRPSRSWLAPRSSAPKASLLSGLLLGAFIAACAGSKPAPTDEELGVDHAAISGTSGATTTATPIGLALDVDGGTGTPLQVRAGQTFYVNQIDLRTSIDAVTDEGVDGLRRSGDFTKLDWGGVKLIEEEPVLLANGDGTFTRRRFYREADWMNDDGEITVEQLDATGRVVDGGVTLETGKQHKRRDSDDFWVRRYRAIQWTYDCPGLHDCTGAKHFSEEALVELRNATHPDRTFVIASRTTALRLTWSQRRKSPWIIPVTQVSAPTWDYGFSIDVAEVAPPPGGVYAPGSDVTMQLTLRDGAGKRLHDPGVLPTYDEAMFSGPENAPTASGITYYRAFFDPTTTYYRRKHRERNFIAQIIGPAQDIQPIRTVAPLSLFLDTEVHPTGSEAVDGVFAEMRLFPPSPDLFGGAFDPTHAGWAKPVTDTWSWHLPADARPGTYLVTVKARRVYLGQDIPATTTVSIQVGTSDVTHATLNTGGCNDCHEDNSSLNVVLHANSNRAACAGCHVPLGFELEGPIYVRTHFLHSRSGRFGEPLFECKTCHLSNDSIQRTSKSACLSCHTSYPPDHVKKYGPIESMYYGGGPESFLQCSSTCHTTHPGSGLH